MDENKEQRWTLEKARKQLDASVVDVEGKLVDVVELLVAIDELFSEIGKDENFSGIEASALINYVKKRYGKETGLGKPELSRLLKEAQSIRLNGDGEMAADHEAIAREVIDEMSRGGDLRFTPDRKSTRLNSSH